MQVVELCSYKILQFLTWVLVDDFFPSIILSTKTTCCVTSGTLNNTYSFSHWPWLQCSHLHHILLAIRKCQSSFLMITNEFDCEKWRLHLYTSDVLLLIQKVAGIFISVCIRALFATWCIALFMLWPSVCLPVTSVLYQNGWNDRAGFPYRGYSLSILHCFIR